MGPRLLVARNVLKAWLLLGGWVGALTALGWWLGEFRVASVFFVLTLLMSATVHWYGARIILTALGARELTLGEGAALHATAERLAREAGVARPKLYLLADGHPRALTVGRGAGDFGIAVSQGLLALTTPAELEGVLAHELAHARHRDVTIQTPVVLIAVSRRAGSAASSGALSSSSSRRSPRASPTSCSRRSGSSPPTRRRPRPAAPRTRSRTRSFGSSRPSSSSSSGRALRPSRSTRSTRSGRTGSRGCSTRTRPSASASGACATSTRAGGRGSARPSTPR